VARMVRWLLRHGFARDDQDSDSNETSVFTFDEMLAQGGAGRGTFEDVEGCHDDTRARSSETNPRPMHCDGAVTLCGLNLHASVCIAADDRGIEQPCR